MSKFATFNELFRLDPSTGQLYWRHPGKGRQSGPVGHQDRTGYRRVCVNHRMYLVHRIVFLLTHKRWPTVCDHINNDPGDNRPDNLREVSARDNNLNSGLQRRNSTGAKGLYLNQHTQKWEVRRAGKYLGAFYDKREAIECSRRFG